MGLSEDEEFQKELQALFVEKNRDKYGEIKRALEAGDMETTRRFVHTLKSNAGQLGKKKLQEIAAEIEGLLKEGKTPVSAEKMAALEKELAAVLKEFAQ
jgi:HPt (histidine-containing phosphotransfer) domain-containing protein